MKVIFDNLDKTTLVTTAYQVLSEKSKLKDNKSIRPLTVKQLSSIDSYKEINTLNGVYLGLKFNGNYVDFDDNLTDLYLSILFKMKITNQEFVNKMKEDFIVEFQYNNYLKEIKAIEQNIDECKYVMARILKQAIDIKSVIEKSPNSLVQLIKPFNDLKESKEKIDRDVEILLELRKSKIKEVFRLEGLPNEEKNVDEQVKNLMDKYFK